jgi:hypothetical protein
MNEQLLMFLLGLSWYVTLVWWRRRTSLLLFLAVICWWAAILTRVIILPIGVPIIILMVLLSHRPLLNAFLAGLITIVFLLPAAKFTYDRTGSWSPFGFMQVNKIYALSKHSRIHFTFDDRSWYWFECPIYAGEHQPFEPLLNYRPKKTDEFQFTINRSGSDRGMVDWARVEHDLASKFTWSDYGDRVVQNIIFSHFNASWPESSTDPNGPWAERLAYLSRVIWAPFTLILLWGAIFGRFTMKQSLFYGATLVLLLALIFQNNGIMEGRFRKPYEPMVIIAVAMFFTSQSKNYINRNIYINILRYIKKIFNNFWRIKNNAF